VLNSIEFWTGSNPMAMNKGEKETQIVQKGDDTYKLTAEKNKIHIEKIAGENSGEEGEFIWNDETQNWTFVGEGKTFEVLIEGESKRSENHQSGRNSQNKIFVFPKEDTKTGEYANVQIHKCTSATLLGEIVRNT